MKHFLFITTIILLFSCSEEIKESQKETNIITDEVLKEVKDGIYTEYYSKSRLVKIQGSQDTNDVRNGKWAYYSKNGEELSITYFKKGKREGHTIVKYPNGSLNYVGEYKDDQMTGIWKFYDGKGNIKQEKDYGKASN